VTAPRLIVEAGVILHGNCVIQSQEKKDKAIARKEIEKNKTLPFQRMDTFTESPTKLLPPRISPGETEEGNGGNASGGGGEQQQEQENKELSAWKG